MSEKVTATFFIKRILTSRLLVGYLPISVRRVDWPRHGDTARVPLMHVFLSDTPLSRSSDSRYLHVTADGCVDNGADQRSGVTTN